MESYKVSLQSTARENDRLNEDLKSAKREIINYENSTKKLEEEIVQQRDEIGKNASWQHQESLFYILESLYAVFYLKIKPRAQVTKLPIRKSYLNVVFYRAHDSKLT